MKKLISILLVAVMVLSMSVTGFAEIIRDTISFPDVKEGDWFYESVEYCAYKWTPYIAGYSNGRFGPADNLQRQDFAVILRRFCQRGGYGLNDDEREFYANPKNYYGLNDEQRAAVLSDKKYPTDIDINAYYGDAVLICWYNGLINGYDNGKFGIGDKITREQVVTIIYRYENNPEVTEEMYAALDNYSDASQVSSWARAAFAWAIENGIIKGKNDTTLAPQANIVRAEIATIFYRLDRYHYFYLGSAHGYDFYLDPWTGEPVYYDD